MTDKLVTYGPQYSVYGLEAVLFAYLLWRGLWQRLTSVFFYLFLLLAVDAIGRPYVLYRYGLTSRQYGYFFWLTDVLLVLAAFLVVCAFFRRACAGKEEKLWHSLRIILVFVFPLTLGISFLSLSRNYSHLFSRFIYEFSQNLYFTCLVLNTLLYLLMQQLEDADDELGFLVCGLGIQFAGPAACLALLHLTSGQPYAQSLNSFIAPVCTLGMLLTWFYAVTRMPRAEAVRESARVPALADVALPGGR